MFKASLKSLKPSIWDFSFRKEYDPQHQRCKDVVQRKSRKEGSALTRCLWSLKKNICTSWHLKMRSGCSQHEMHFQSLYAVWWWKINTLLFGKKLTASLPTWRFFGFYETDSKLIWILFTPTLYWLFPFNDRICGAGVATNPAKTMNCLHWRRQQSRLIPGAKAILINAKQSACVCVSPSQPPLPSSSLSR